MSTRTLKPLDVDAVLRAAEETVGIVTIEEHTINGGLGSTVAETLLDHGAAPRTFLRIGLQSGFSSAVGCQQFLRGRYGLDSESIAQRTVKLLNAKSARSKSRPRKGA